MPQRKSNYRDTLLMDKICGVCNDKALGYNFNAVTCESCKAFFRRNAMKNKDYKSCPFDDKCRLSPESRKFCQKCRLKKCFEIGMNPNLVQTGEQLEKRANSAVRKALTKRMSTIKKKSRIQEQKEFLIKHEAPSPVPTHYSPIPCGPLQAYPFHSPPLSPFVMPQHPPPPPSPYMVPPRTWSAPASVVETSMRREPPEIEMVSIPKDMLLRLLQSHPKYSCRCSCSCGKYDPNAPIVSQINRHRQSPEERTIMQLE